MLGIYTGLLILYSRGSVYICGVCMQCVCVSVYIWIHIHIIGIWESKISDIITREIDFWNTVSPKKTLYCRNGNRVVPRTWVPFSSLPFLLSLLSSGRHILQHFCFKQVPNITMGTLPPKGMESNQHPQPLLVPCDWAISSFNLSSLKAILQLTPILLKNLVLLPNPSMLSSSW